MISIIDTKRSFLDKIPLTVSKVLDIGCSRGYMSKRFAKRGIPVTGIDKRKQDIKQENFTFENVDIREFNLKDYDLVINSLMLHFLSWKEAENVINKMQKSTNVSGCNLLIVFSDKDKMKRDNRFYPTLKKIKKLYLEWKLVDALQDETETEINSSGEEHRHNMIFCLFKKSFVFSKNLMKINSYQEFKNLGATEELDGHIFSRNNISIYSIDKDLVVLKRFKSGISAKREYAAYTELLDNPLVQVPFRHFAEGDVALYDYIKASTAADPYQRIIDWAMVHNRQELTDVFKKRNPKREKIARSIENIRKRSDLFGANNNSYADYLEERTSELEDPSLAAFTHGDLRVNNSIPTIKGIYYIDFEFSGVTHPAVDIIPTLLAYPRIASEILSRYNAHSNFDSKEIEQAIPLYVIFRAIHVLAMQEKRKLSEEVRIPVRNRFLQVMNATL